MVVVRKWAATLGEEAWPAALQVGCAKFFAASDDTRVMAVLKQMLAVPASEPHRQVVRRAAQRRLALLPAARHAETTLALALTLTLKLTLTLTLTLALALALTLTRRRPASTRLTRRCTSSACAPCSS